jgi:hypothetical protein
MEDVQQLIVNEHIGDLRREAERLRSERSIADQERAEECEATPAATGRTDPRGARVRVGHWLIGVGTAVAGSGGDRQGGAAGHAA